MPSPLRAMFFALCGAASTVPASLLAQDSQDVERFRSGEAEVRVWRDDSGRHAAVRRPGRSWQTLARPDRRLGLRTGAVDPRQGFGLPPALAAPPATRLFLVQFHTQPLAEYRGELEALGADIRIHVPYQAYVVRMDGSVLESVRSLPCVRWAGPLPLGVKVEEEMAAALAAATARPEQDYDLIVVDRLADPAPLVTDVEAAGGAVVFADPGSLRMRVRLPWAAVRSVAGHDAVLWMNRGGEPGLDVDIARAQAGADHVESQAGLTGKGLSGWVTEGVDGNHTEFAPTAFRGPPLSLLVNSPAGHGTNTAGIIYARGVNAPYRGFVPDARLSHTDLYTVQAQRNTATTMAVDPTGPHLALFETASWGGGRTTSYNSDSAEIDDVLFRLDIPHTQSQSNAGGTSNPRDSRPQAWGKNVMGIGGIRHYGDPNTLNHAWANSGSTGPAADGRFKPELVGFYDDIGTTNLGGGYTNSFGGTSGATPINNGALALTIDMITLGMFGHEAVVGEIGQRFGVKPHNTTPRALLINTARPYAFSQATRDQQGWGFPSVGDMFDRRNEMLVVDESEVLANLESRSYLAFVPPGGDHLRCTMVYSDPAASPFANPTRINDLDLTVRTLDGSTVWHGNHGLGTNQLSPSGGSKDGINTAENVFLDQPASGVYVVEVDAAAVNQDSHVETAAVDADFALVISGTEGYRNGSRMKLEVDAAQPGQVDVRLTNLPGGWAEGWTFFSTDIRRREAFGSFLGIERDGLVDSILASPAAAGDLFHFTTGGAGQYPTAPYSFSGPLALAVQGMTFDALAVVTDASGNVMAVSNATRFTVQ